MQRTSRECSGSTLTTVVLTDSVQVGRQALVGVIPEQLGFEDLVRSTQIQWAGHLQSGHPRGERVRDSLARKSTFYTSDEKYLVRLWLQRRRRGTQAHADVRRAALAELYTARKLDRLD